MTKPKPALTLWDLTAVAINGIIGAGIFGLPALVARDLGVASPIAFVLCAAIVSLFALCFAEVASRFTESGGPYVYCRSIFGSFAAFEVGWAAWIARVASFSANSNLLISYLTFFVPSVASGVPRALVLTAIPLMLAIVNIRGVAMGAGVVDVFAAIKVGALLLFGVAGLGALDWTRFAGASIPAEANWGAAILLVLYAFTGFENAVIPSAEMKNPRKHPGWALILALGACALIYIVVQVVVVGTLSNAGASDKPLADAAQIFVGPTGAALISMLVCVSVIGNLSGSALVVPRLTYAFSERKDFPEIFGRLHPAYGTPVASIIFFAVVACVLSISGQFVWLATISVVGRLANYLVTCLALPVLRQRSTERPAFRIPLGYVISISGTLLCIWLLAQVTWNDLRAFGLACIAGALFYFVNRVILRR